jgi:hypothetical protein
MMAHRNFHTRKQARLQHDANLAAHAEKMRQIADTSVNRGNQANQQTQTPATEPVQTSSLAGHPPVKGSNDHE